MQDFSKNQNNDNTFDMNAPEIFSHRMPFGTYPLRFWPISTQYDQGAKDFVVAQYVHTIGNTTFACPKYSYDYSGPDIGDRPQLNLPCPTCSDIYNLWQDFDKDTAMVKTKYIRRKARFFSNVSFYINGQMSAPKVFHYTQQLYDAIKFHTLSALSTYGRLICDPEKGFLFNVVINEADGRRNYKSSSISLEFNTNVSITGVDWKSMLPDIKSKLLPIKSHDELVDICKTSNIEGSGTNKYNIPSFNNVAPAPINNVPPINNVASIPPAPINNVPPINNIANIPPAPINNVANVPLEHRPCFASVEGAAGYIENDGVCMGCPENTACKAITLSKNVNSVQPFNSQVQVNNPSVQPVQPINSSIPVINSNETPKSIVDNFAAEKQLAALRSKVLK